MKHPIRHSNFKIFAIALLWLAAVSAHAQCTSCFRTISSASSNNINVPQNKTLCVSSTGSITGSVSLGNNSKLCIEGSFTPSSFSAAWGASITNSGTATLPSSFQVTGALENTGNLTVNGNLTASNSKSITNSGTLNVNGNMSNQGAFTNSGTTDITGSYSNQKTLTNSGIIETGTDFTNTSSGGVSAENTGNILVGSSFTNQGPLQNKTGASIQVAGSFSNTNSGSATLTNNASIEVLGSFANANDLTNNGTLDIGGDFSNANDGNASVGNYGDLFIDGDVSNYQRFYNKGVVDIKGGFTQTNAGNAELENDSSFTIGGNTNSNNDIKNTGALVIGGIYTNQKWSGSYQSEPNSILIVDSFINESNVTSSSSVYGQIQVVSYAENSGNIGTYIDLCILSNSGNWNSNTGTVNANVVSCTQTVTSQSVSLNVSVFLEACYNSSSHKMQTTLRENKQLPKNQPFDKGLWKWSGKKSVEDSVADIAESIVDWVLVSFRTSTAASSTFSQQSFFLTASGQLRDGMGNPALVETPSESSFYIVVTSRNHLGVMSANKVSVQGGSITYDFTTAQSQAYTTGAAPMMEVATGIYGLISGDVNGDGTINAIDAQAWYAKSGSSGYDKADLNLDNQINSSDKDWWKSRNGMSIQFQND